MYQPRHVTDVDTVVLPIVGDSAAEAARYAGPRRAVKPQGVPLVKAVVPGVVAMAMSATAGVAMANQSNQTNTVATPALELRTADALSRDVTRPAPATAAAAQPSAKAAWASAFAKPAGTRYAQKGVSVFAAASSSAKKLGSLKAGAKVQITDRVVSGYREVIFDSKIGFVRDSALGATAPKVEAPVVKKTAKSAKATTPRRAAASSSTSAEKYSGSTTYSGKRVLGLTPKAMVVYNAVMAKWGGQINSVGGWRASSRSDHQYGRAIDFMITPGAESALGWSIAKYLAANASTFGIDHIIFEQKIWTPYKPYWRPMENRGSITQNHYDHVHVSV